jgi:hypothetical protein
MRIKVRAAGIKLDAFKDNIKAGKIFKGGPEVGVRAGALAPGPEWRRLGRPGWALAGGMGQSAGCEGSGRGRAGGRPAAARCVLQEVQLATSAAGLPAAAHIQLLAACCPQDRTESRKEK